MSLSLSTGYAPSDMCNIITDNISTKKKKKHKHNFIFYTGDKQ